MRPVAEPAVLPAGQGADVVRGASQCVTLTGDDRLSAPEATRVPLSNRAAALAFFEALLSGAHDDSQSSGLYAGPSVNSEGPLPLTLAMVPSASSSSRAEA